MQRVRCDPRSLLSGNEFGFGHLAVSSGPAGPGGFMLARNAPKFDDARRMVVRLPGHGWCAWEAAAQRSIDICVPETTPVDRLSAWNPTNYRATGRRLYIPPDPAVQAVNPIPRLRRPTRKRGSYGLISSWEQPTAFSAANIVVDQCGVRRVRLGCRQHIICARFTAKDLDLGTHALMRPVAFG